MTGLAFLLVLASANISPEGIRAVDIAGDVEVSIRVDPRATPALRIDGDAELTREKELLRVRGEDTHRSPKIFLVVGSLEAVRAAGKAQVQIVGLSGGDIEIRAGDAARVSLDGTSAGVTVVASGTARVHGARLTAVRVSATLRDAARAEVNASSSLTCDLARASRLVVSGSPGQVQKRISGVAELVMR